MDINLARILITFGSGAQSLPELLSSGRAKPFEDALTDICCKRRGSICNSCSLSDSCLVQKLPGRLLSTDPAIVRRHQKPGLPYIFELLSASNDSSQLFGLTLLEPVYGYLPVFLKILKHLAGQDTLFSISAIDYQNNVTELDLNASGEIANLPLLSANELLNSYSRFYTGTRQIQIVLHSPLRLVRDGRELSHFDPVFFIRSLLRRISSLVAYYGNGVDSEFFQYLAEQSGRFRLIKSAPASTGTVIRQRGVTGSYIISGQLDELGPYLSLGTLLHLGKGASYGMGAFRINPI